MTKRSRSAGSGEFVSREEAAAKPAETVTESIGKGASLEKRVARLERVITESGGPLARIFERLC